MEGKPKVQTFTFSDDIPTSKDMKTYNEIVNEMRESKDQMDKKYGQGWDGLTRREYDWMMGLSNRKEEIEAKYPNYDFKNKKIKNEIRQKGNENNMIENRDFEKFLKNENAKTYEVETRNVSLMSENEPVKVNNMADYMVLSLVERANLFGQCQAFAPANGVLAIPKESENNLDDTFEFVGENTALDVHKIQFETVKAEAQRIGVAIKVTEQMLLNSGVDVQSYVLDLLARKLSRAVEKQMVNGNSEGHFEGLASLTKQKHNINEFSVSALDSDALLDCVHAVHPDYLDGAVFVVNRETYNAVSKLKDASGQYVLKLERSVANEATHYSAFGFKVLIHDQVPANQVYFVNMKEAYASLMPRSVRVKKIDNDSTNALNATVVYMVDCYLASVCKNGKAVVRMNLQA